MAEKRECQGGRASDPAQAAPKLLLDLAEIVGAQVGELAALDVPPDELGRVEVRGVAGPPGLGRPRTVCTNNLL